VTSPGHIKRLAKEHNVIDVSTREYKDTISKHDVPQAPDDGLTVESMKAALAKIRAREGRAVDDDPGQGRIITDEEAKTIREAAV